MTPEDIKQVVDAVASSGDNTLVYVLTSIAAVLVPVIIWASKIVFKKTIDQVVDEAITPQIELLEKTFERDNKAQEQMFSIMEMHIEELRHVKFEQEEIKRKVKINEEDIERIRTRA